MSTSNRLGLPLIDAAQAQKHVTHNEALKALNFEGSMAAKAVSLAMEGNMLGIPPHPARDKHNTSG